MNGKLGKFGSGLLPTTPWPIPGTPPHSSCLPAISRLRLVQEISVCAFSLFFFFFSFFGNELHLGALTAFQGGHGCLSLKGQRSKRMVLYLGDKKKSREREREMSFVYTLMFTDH